MGIEQPFTAADDSLHEASSSHYETETFWFSFFVPDRALGGWVYTSVRQRAGVTGGGLWIWDATGVDPWEIPFYEQFACLKLPTVRAGTHLSFPTGMQIVQRVPLMSYDITYEDRDRVSLQLRFDAVEPPVPLMTGAPPYPSAHHFDQTGKVTGSITLDGEHIDVDCFAMRDRSWGPRPERGYRRVGYCWAADAETSFLAYSSPQDDAAAPGTDTDTDTDQIYAGYLRRQGELARLVSGERRIERDPQTNWVTAIDLRATDSLGRELHARSEAKSRMILPHSTAVCVNSVLPWVIDGRVVYGEDQDVWPIHQWRQALVR